MKETVWNRPEKVDHLAYKNLCVLQGSGIIKMIRKFGQVLVKLQTLAQKDVYGTTRTRGVTPPPPPHFYDVTCIFRI